MKNLPFLLFFLQIIKIQLQSEQIASFTPDQVLNLFEVNYRKAKQDPYFNLYEAYFKQKVLDHDINQNEKYKNIETYFFSLDKSSQLYYIRNPLINYKISFPNENYYLWRIMVDPCKKFKRYCCENLADCEEDNTEIKAGWDLEIAWISNNFIPICENEFDSDRCGTFIEIHMPSKEEIIKDVKIHDYYVNGFKTLFINTTKLCAGRYEFWVVSRIRSVNYLIYVKQFNVIYPSCTCSYVQSLNYTCNIE